MINVPETMRALVLREPGIAGLRVESVAVPAPADGEVVVRVAACGVGGTVLKKVEHSAPAQLPLVPGHEASGEVAALGAGVTDVAVGDRVLLYYYASCGRCRFCVTGRQPLCRETPTGGYYKLGEHRDGGYAEYVAVPRRNVLALPDGLDHVAATAAIDAVATPLHVCERAGLRPGERLLVTGAAGGVGAHLVQVAGWYGAEVVAVDVGDKLDEVAGQAIVERVDAADPAWAARLARKCDVAVDFVGTPGSLNACFDALGRGGRLVVLAGGQAPEVAFRDFHRIVSGELSVIGSKYADPAEVMRAADLLAAGTVRPVVSETCGLEEVPAMLTRIRDGDLLGRGALRFDDA